MDYENEANYDLEIDEVEAEEIEAEVEKSIAPDVQRGVYYVDKVALYDAYVEWYKHCDAAKDQGLDRPDPPKYISESIIKICQGLASRYNFANYPFREEMVGDAIENIYRYIDRYDLNHPKKNPFGYFSITAYWAMVRRIKLEKEEAGAKYHVLINSGILDTLNTQDHDDGMEYQKVLNHLQMNANDSMASMVSVVKKRKKIVKVLDVVDVESMLDGE